MDEQEYSELLEKCSESILSACTFENGLLTIILELYSGDQIELHIRTTALETFDLKNSKNPLIATCRLSLEKVSSHLSTENNIYVPSTDFGTFMKEVKNGYSLAYGKKSTKNMLLFSLKGYENLVSCIVNNLEDISFHYV